MKADARSPLGSLFAALIACVLLGLPFVAFDIREAQHWEQFLRIITFRDYNTSVVLLGTMLLGICGGIVGVFMLLRKRSLIGDVVGHSALPGICIAFILSQWLAPGSAKNTPLLIGGAFLSGLVGAVCVLLIDRYSRIKSDAALAIVLSLFYGLGTALLTTIQRLPTASAAGLKDYLNGKTSALVAADVWVFAGVAVGLSLITLLLFKELTLLCFDSDFATASGWPTFWLDTLLTGLVVGVTIIGMQTVGLVLVVAILIIPAASARFWTDDVRALTIVSAIAGALAALLGSVISALAPKVAAGAVIVLSGSVLFLISLVFGHRRGLVWRLLDQRRLRRRVGRHDLLRAIYERIEAAAPDDDISESRLLQAQFRRDDLLPLRSWQRSRLNKILNAALHDELVEFSTDGRYRLTADGAALARRAVRNHRLWEIYLITYADVAPSQVDTDADRIEHVLGPDLVRELEQRLIEADDKAMPASPHQLPGAER